MSLDVYLYVDGQTGESGSGIFVRENGATVEISRAEWDEKFPGREPIVAQVSREAVYDANITHNLGQMADKAGIYKALWRPEEIEVTRASQLIDLLEAGLDRLKAADYFKQFNPDNGWGNYDNLVTFTERYLAACKEYPTARIDVSR